MSKNEYSFHNSRRRALQIDVPKRTPVSKTDEKVSEIILGQYDHYHNLIKNEGQIRELYLTQEKISQEITNAVNLIQSKPDVDTYRQLNDKLNHLTALHKKITAEYDDLLKKELSVLYEKWPAIYEKIIEGIERDTLEHVLTMFDQYQSGQKSANDAVVNGMDFMTRKYNLPSDFFNKSAVNRFNEQLNNRK